MNNGSFNFNIFKIKIVILLFDPLNDYLFKFNYL